jgi:hypothetical protein
VAHLKRRRAPGSGATPPRLVIGMCAGSRGCSRDSGIAQHTGGRGVVPGSEAVFDKAFGMALAPRRAQGERITNGATRRAADPSRTHCLKLSCLRLFAVYGSSKTRLETACHARHHRRFRQDLDARFGRSAQPASRWSLS